MSLRESWRPFVGAEAIIHMPRWASRILLEVAEIRVERLLDITPNGGTDGRHGMLSGTMKKPMPVYEGVTRRNPRDWLLPGYLSFPYGKNEEERFRRTESADVGYSVQCINYQRKDQIKEYFGYRGFDLLGGGNCLCCHSDKIRLCNQLRLTMKKAPSGKGRRWI